MKLVLKTWVNLLIVMVISFSSLCAQPEKDINQTDVKGLKQGFWKVSYENGKPKYEGWFKDNKPVGLLKRFYDDGTLKAQILFDKTGKKAYTKMYYQNGVLAGEGNFIESMRDSVWKFYSFYDSSLRVEEAYKNGVKYGLSKKLYYSGKVAEELTYIDNKKEGKWIQYFESGTIKLKTTYVNDKREGDYVVNYPSGKPEITGIFKNNLMEADWHYFDEDGNLLMTVKYVGGVPQNTNDLDKKQEDFFKKMEENKGKYPEPDETNIAPIK